VNDTYTSHSTSFLLKYKSFKKYDTMYTVYILQCADDSLYTGIARNLDKRLADHETSKGSKYVRTRLPFQLVYNETQPNRSSATKREMEIKKMTREKKLALIKKS